jgi:hypothetical protein
VIAYAPQRFVRNTRDAGQLVGEIAQLGIGGEDTL